MGKTSLAATFQNPIFIRAEDGMQAIPAATRPKAFPVLRAAIREGVEVTVQDQIRDQLGYLLREKHDFKTVVFDSVTALESIFTDHIVDSDPKKPKGIQQALGGYGAGRDAVASMHRRLRMSAESLVTKRGMNVVFIAHAETTKIDPPDAESYTKYVMRMHEKSQQPYLDNVDLVGFLRLQTFITGETGERKLARSSGTLELVCHATATNVSKNRYGITEPMVFEMGKNPLEAFIPQLKGTTK
jgi:hypothetical protein